MLLLLSFQGVVVLNNGRILVCDSNNQCVQVAITIGDDVVDDDDVSKDDYLQVFSPTGALLSRWGVRGRGPGQLQRPTGIAVMKVDIVITTVIIVTPNCLPTTS